MDFRTPGSTWNGLQNTWEQEENGKEKQAGTKALSFLKETPESKKKMKKQLHDSERN